MFDERTRDTQRLLSLFDILSAVASFGASVWIFECFWQHEQVDLFSHIAILPLILALLIFSLPYFDAYRSPRSASNIFYISAIFKTMAAVLGVVFIVLFILNVYYVSRAIVLSFAVIDMLLMIGIRILLLHNFRKALGEGRGLLSVLVIGSGDRAAQITKTLKKKAEWGIDIIGYLDNDPALVGSTVLDNQVLGTVNDIHTMLKSHVIDEVIVAIPRSMIADVDSIALACEEEGVKFRFMADIFNLAAARISLTNLAGIPLLTLDPVALDETKLMIKRGLDLFLTLIALPFILPVIVVVALAIKLDDGGPIFFIQQRVGLKKRIFPMLKFRTMHVNAEEMLKDIEHLNEMDGPNFKIANDPRITRVGRFLRHTSLDELPQLLNVIRGEMSLVGPRPMSIRDVELFDKGIQRKRFSVKPGITCIWQVSGRNELPFHKWLELDLLYIDTWSLSLDIWILLKTIPVVLLRKGAM